MGLNPDTAMLLWVMVTGILSGIISSVAVIAVIKTDITWLKESVKRAHERIDSLKQAWP